MGKENQEIIKFAKEKLEEAKQKLYITEVIAESIKEYEKHRTVYLKNEWTYEDIGRAMANIMIVKVTPPICAAGSSATTSDDSLHKHFVSGSATANKCNDCGKIDESVKTRPNGYGLQCYDCYKLDKDHDNGNW